MESLLLTAVGILIGYWSHLLVDKIIFQMGGETPKTKGFEVAAITMGIVKSTIYFAVGVVHLTIVACLNELNLNLTIFRYAILTLCIFGIAWLAKSIIIASKYHIDLYIAKIIDLRRNYLLEKRAKFLIRQAEAKKILEAEALSSRLSNEIPSRGILENIN